MFSLKTWTVSPAITRTKTRNSTRGILQLRLQFNYPDEFGTQKKVSSEAVPLTKEQRSLPNDATQLASNDSKRAQIIPIPFSAETTGAQVLDTKLSADLSGLPANLTEKNASLHETLLASCPDDNGDHDVALGRDDAPFHDNVLPRDDNDDSLLGDDDDEDDDASGIRS